MFGKESNAGYARNPKCEKPAIFIMSSIRPPSHAERGKEDNEVTILKLELRVKSTGISQNFGGVDSF
jgi:hypothetical protein